MPLPYRSYLHLKLATDGQTDGQGQSSRPSGQKLDWLRVAELCEETMLKFFFKHVVMNIELNFLFYDIFKFRASPNADRSVRKKRNPIAPLTKPVFGQNSFSFRIVKCWNNLPASIQFKQTVLGFNTLIKAHIISSRSDGYLSKLV